METFRIKGLKIPSTRLLCGTWAFGADYWENQQDKDSRAVMRQAVNTGLNHFDTAFSYGKGKSEQLTGQFFHKSRNNFILSTKDLPGSDAHLEKNFQKSLSRLLTDYVDLYYVHWPLPKTNWKEVTAWISKKKEQGKILSSGICNVTLEEYLSVSSHMEINALQTGFNLLYDGGFDTLIPSAAKNGTTVIVYSPLAQGLLSGNYINADDFSSSDRRRNLIFFYPEIHDTYKRAISDLMEISTASKIPISTIALSWVFFQPGISGTCVGARNDQQAKDLFCIDPKAVPESVRNQAHDATQKIRALTRSFPNIFNHVFR